MPLTNGDPGWIAKQELIKKQWATTLFQEVWDEAFFPRFTGSSSNSVIQTNTMLKAKGAGDSVRFGIIYNLGGKPKFDNQRLQGAEDVLTEDYMDVTLHLMRKGIRIDRYDDKGYQAFYDMRAEAKDQIKNYYIDYFDRMFFDVLAGKAVTADDGTTVIIPASAPTADRTVPTLAAVTLDDISGLKEIARMAKPKIRPVKVNGADHYVFIMHPYAARALKASDEWKQVNQLADVRGGQNKLFTGSLGVWDNVILFEHENVSVDDVDDPTLAQNLFLGAQAGVLAEQRDYFWREDLTDDYQYNIGVMAGCIRGFKKTQFVGGRPDSTGTPVVSDFGLLTVPTTVSKWTGAATP